ncbi:MAG: glutaredoxin [Propionicimonas sp.]
METRLSPQAAAPHVVLVTAAACHLCEDAEASLTPLAAQGAIELDTVAADSPAGATLVGRHRPALFPLVVVGGEFFSSGRLPRGKLARALGLDRTAL